MRPGMIGDLAPVGRRYGHREGEDPERSPAQRRAHEGGTPKDPCLRKWLAKGMPRCGWRKTGRFIFSILAQRRRAEFARFGPRPGFQIVGGSINCDQFRSSFNCASRCPRTARGRFDCQVASCSLRWLLIRVATVLKTQGTDARLPRNIASKSAATVTIILFWAHCGGCQAARDHKLRARFCAARQRPGLA